jgi:hypothetical protein
MRHGAHLEFQTDPLPEITLSFERAKSRCETPAFRARLCENSDGSEGPSNFRGLSLRAESLSEFSHSLRPFATWPAIESRNRCDPELPVRGQSLGHAHPPLCFLLTRIPLGRQPWVRRLRSGLKSLIQVRGVSDPRRQFPISPGGHLRLNKGRFYDSN